jgi:hypothetical protein
LEPIADNVPTSLQDIFSADHTVSDCPLSADCVAKRF